jgi:hypothetical protein
MPVLIGLSRTALMSAPGRTEHRASRPGIDESRAAAASEKRWLQATDAAWRGQAAHLPM